MYVAARVAAVVCVAAFVVSVAIAVVGVQTDSAVAAYVDAYHAYTASFVVDRSVAVSLPVSCDAMDVMMACDAVVVAAVAADRHRLVASVQSYRWLYP